MMFQDPIIKNIRKIRHDIEKECENDPQKFFYHIQQFQQKYKNRLIQRKPKQSLKVTKNI